MFPLRWVIILKKHLQNMAKAPVKLGLRQRYDLAATEFFWNRGQIVK